jgi:regulator of protease activity HflC (stomatin/prohibitin superfamily)
VGSSPTAPILRQFVDVKSLYSVNNRKMMKNILLALFAGLFSIGCSCATVAPGEVGVGVDMGGLQGDLYQPGFHFVSLTTTVIPMSLQTQTYEMSGNDSIHALTRDQLSVDLEVTINFSMSPEHAIDVYTAYSTEYAARIVHPIVRTAVRDAASTFTAAGLVDHREELQNAMEERVRRDLGATLTQRSLDTAAIRIENILLRNIDLPAALDASIAAVQQQRMQTQQRQQALETATAEAARLRMEAEGEAAARLIRAQADADANRLVAASLTPEVLESRRIEALRATLASPATRTVIVPAGSNPQVRVYAGGDRQ